MDFDYTPEQERLRKDYRARLEAVMTPERRASVATPTEGGAAVADCRRALGEAGLLGVAWPTEYGGGGLTALEQYIFGEEARRVNAPLPMITLNTVGPTLIQFGTDEQKEKFLPAILKGTIDFAIGYSEPGAGSDLASLRTNAVRDGDDFVINGSKMFTSGAEFADYIWLAARTDPEAKKHKGITLFIVPTDAEGFSWKPLHTMPGVSTYYTFYDDVRVPASSIVLGENEGWKLITNQLNHERVAICPASGLSRSLTEVRRWAQEHRLGDGRLMIEHEWVQIGLAKAHAKVEVLKLFNWKVAWAADKGLNPADASATKVYGTELALEIYRLLLDIVGQGGYLVEGSPGTVVRGRLENQARSQTIFTFGGGTNEIQRDIIAMIGLGMPRAPR